MRVCTYVRRSGGNIAVFRAGVAVQSYSVVIIKIGYLVPELAAMAQDRHVLALVRSVWLSLTGAYGCMAVSSCWLQTPGAVNQATYKLDYFHARSDSLWGLLNPQMDWEWVPE